MRKLLLLSLCGVLLAGCVSQKEFDQCTSDKEAYLAEWRKARNEQLEQVKILAEAGYELQQKVQKLEPQLAETQKALAQARQELQTANSSLKETLKVVQSNDASLKKLQKQFEETTQKLADSRQEIEQLKAANADLAAKANRPATQSADSTSTTVE